MSKFIMFWNKKFKTSAEKSNLHHPAAFNDPLLILLKALLETTITQTNDVVSQNVSQNNCKIQLAIQSISGVSELKKIRTNNII